MQIKPLLVVSSIFSQGRVGTDIPFWVEAADTKFNDPYFLESTLFFDPLAETISAYNRMAPSYSKQWFKSDAVADFVTNFADLLPQQASVLDAGCGSGREIAYLLSRNIDCVGIDLSTETIFTARDNVPDGYFRVMDFRNLEYPTSLFDGALCVASVHHLFEEDFALALASFARVLKPNGKLAMTVRLGEGHSYDSHGRFQYFRNAEKVLDTFTIAGFSVISDKISDSGSDRSWLQVVLQCEKEKTTSSAPLCSFCKEEHFMSANVTGGLPKAASILWGDDDFYVAVDRAPLAEGHLLICPSDHVLSIWGSDIPLEGLAIHKRAVENLLHNAYNRKPLFLEHGMTFASDDRNPCIEHAHIHALPLKSELKSRIEQTTGNLTTFRNINSLKEILKGKEYISYEDKQGQIHIRDEGLGSIPSQFFRQVVARDSTDGEFHWASVANNENVLTRFHKTIEILVLKLDEEVSKQQITSNIPEAARVQLSRGQRPSGKAQRTSKANSTLQHIAKRLRKKVREAAELTLSDLGEDMITNDVVFRMFDHGHRSVSYLGDDGAVFPWKYGEDLVVSVDPCPNPVFFGIDFTHYQKTSGYQAYGWLAMVISLSDMAAMGADPKAVVLDCEMPEDMKLGDFVDFLDGVCIGADRYHCRIIGGNLREAHKLRAATTIFGATIEKRAFRRSSAVPGQGVYVVGAMGVFWAAIINQIEGGIVPPEEHNDLERGLFYPDPQVISAKKLANGIRVGACMDASDGPTRCFQEIARLSGVDIEIDLDAIEPEPFGAVDLVSKQSKIDPRALMLTWGNFELVFTADDEELERKFSGTPGFLSSIRRVGEVKSGRGKAFIKSGRTRSSIPDLSSTRFKKGTSLISGIDAYYEALRKVHFN